MTEEIKFEQAMQRLGKIVEDLEEGNVPLETALKKYEEGVRLSRACQNKLVQAEKKIEVLTRSLDGSLQKEPFKVGDQAGKKGKKGVPADGDLDEGDLLI